MANPPDISQFDADQTLRFAFSDTAGVLKVMSGFLLAKNGRKILIAYPTSSTETYTYKESDGSTVIVLLATYTDSTKANISSIERTT